MPYNSIQFSSDTYLPVVSVRPHRLRVRSHKTAPIPHFWCWSQIQVVTWASDQLAINERFPRSSPQVWQFARVAQSTQKTIYLLDYGFIIKGYNPGTARKKRCIVQGMWKGAVPPSPLLGRCATLPARPTWEAFQTLYFRDFYEGFRCRHGWLNHWPLVIDSVEGLSNHVVGFPGGTNPHPVVI